MNISTKNCQSCKQDFRIEPEDFDFYKKIDVPPPTWCWKCRAKRRMVFYNIRYLYERTCAATRKKIFTILPPDAPQPPYSHDYWISDQWDPMDYGKDYDFSKPFFGQIKELFNAVPYAIIWAHESVDSEYGVVAWGKNCYLCFDAGYVEDSAYSVSLQRSKQCFDTINCKSCELCYYCINTNDSYKTFFSRECTSCTDVWFSQDCVGCTDCFGCTGLRNKSYYLWNQPYTKEEYKAKVKELGIDTWSGLQQARAKAMEVWRQFPVKYRHSVQAKDCTGDYIYNSAELRNCFFAGSAQNCAHCQSIIYGPIKDCMDLTSVGEYSELNYETNDTGVNVQRIFFSSALQTVTDSQYSINCRQSSNLFGCVALKGKKYCIFNKQYSKEEYETLVPKIIEHMNAMPYTDAQGRIYRYGEFFPVDMSPWGYNETQAQEYFPLEKEEIEAQGFRWRTFEKRNYEITKTSTSLPDRFDETGDDILHEVIQCRHDEQGKHPNQCSSGCATAFRITAQELQFYRRMNLPLPRLCFNCRHQDRLGWRNTPELWPRRCMCAGAVPDKGSYKNFAEHFHGLEHCPNEFETSYSSDKPETVYCEACYQAEVA